MGEIKIDGATLEYEVETNNSDVQNAKQYVTVVGVRDVQGYIEIPAEIENLPVKCIGGLAFAGCSGLTSVTIPDSVVWIRESAFAFANSLACVKIPQSVIVIGECAFSGCGRLRWVEIPEGVMWVGLSAFYMCFGLVRVSLPSTLESIPRYAFANCCSLSNVTISSGVTSIEEEAFSGCCSLSSVMIPDGMTCIKDGAFSSCSSLASVSLPRCLEKESLDSAFVSCSPALKITYRDGENAHTVLAETAFLGEAAGMDSAFVKSDRWHCR